MFQKSSFMKKYSVFVFLVISVLSCSTTKKEHHDLATGDELWYKQPATNWMTESLPIGNGYMGAMFFGGIEKERIQFNEESLWVGGKGEWDAYNGGNREASYPYLPKVRELLNAGKFDEAHALAQKKFTGVLKPDQKSDLWEGFGAYQPFGDIYVGTDHNEEISEYNRKLSLTDGMGFVHYKAGETTYKRDYFGSYPKRALVFRFQNDNPSGATYTIHQETVHKNVRFRFEDNQLIMSGALENNKMGFESRLLVESDGEVSFVEGKLVVKSATSVVLYLVAATDYVNEYPHYTGRDYKALNKRTIKAIRTSSYKEIVSEHKKDYATLYSRVSLQMGDSMSNKTPTDERLKAYASGQKDQALEALYFQYGRYLIISSSRPGTLPANLQGKWNDKSIPTWASDYHANINIQMIYWPVEVANLAECHEPLIEYIDKLRAPGRETVKNYFNSRGWVVNTANNIFGYTAPGWGLPWGFFPGGAAWYSRHAWEHYEFSGDKGFLSSQGYPIMKEAAEFWLDYLSEDTDGKLISSPSYSPENGGISTGAYMDIEIVWDAFTNCIKACEVLGDDQAFKQELIIAKSKLLPLKIGKWGQLQEWKEDRDDPESKHRHVSHLYALYPSGQISSAQTPKLAEAAKVSLKARGDDGTGWSIAWKINFWARLQDGNHAYGLLKKAMKITSEDGVNYMGGGGLYSNMFSTHPPFQLDGNMGATAGIAEMLLQSHTPALHILPALPDDWENGAVKGLKARGDIEVDIQWKDGKLVGFALKAKENKTIKVKYGDTEKMLNLSANKKVHFNANLSPL